MSTTETAQTSLITRVAGFATILVLAILVSSAYLRLTAPDAPCTNTADCASAEQRQAGTVPPERRVARLVHRLSASTVAVLALLVTFIAWSAKDARAQQIRMLTLLLVCLTVFLAVLGALTRSTYTPAITLGNVLGSNALAAMFFWIWLRGVDQRTVRFVPRQRPVWPLVAVLATTVHLCIVTLYVDENITTALAVAYNFFATLLLLASLVWLKRTATGVDSSPPRM